MLTAANHRQGRHRRARGEWWSELLWPGTTAAVTVPQALRQWHRERTPTRGAASPRSPAGPSVQHATPDASAPDGQPATTAVR